ncbi:MAG TPA: universal stress protein [Chloroflexota bacterium]|nr:universal stress protein [Chloroflexota bacterium]
MFTKILVPLDGSELSERAVPYATVLAKAATGSLTLMRVVSDPAHEAEAKAELATVAEKIAKIGVNADSRVIYGHPAEMIIDAAASDQHTMIVMSTHGRSGLGRWLYGSVADQVLREATVPVLLVPAACARVWSDQRSFRILAPLDGSDLAEEALAPVTRLADELSAELLLFQAVEPAHYAYADTYPYPLNDVESELVAADAYLNDVAKNLQKPARVIRARSVAGYAPMAIATAAVEEQADLIAMATHGSGGVRRLVMGSVAVGTLHRATVPLLLIRSEIVSRSTLDSGVIFGLEDNGGPATQTIFLSTSEWGLVCRGLEALLAHESENTDVHRATQTLLNRVNIALKGQTSEQPQSAKTEKAV